MSRVLVFIPMYNCEKQIPRVIRKLSSIANDKMEFLFVDNGSKDQTLSVCISTLASTETPVQYKVIKNLKNVGLGGSHKVAVNYAMENNFDFITVLHGDDQGDIRDIQFLLQDLETFYSSNVDCWLGARFMKGSSLKGYSSFRIFGNIVFNFIYSIVSGVRIYDLGSGLNVYRVTSLKKITQLNEFPNDLTFNCALLLASIFYKMKIVYFPIHWVEDDQISNVKLFRQSLKTLMIAYHFFTQKISGICLPSNRVETKDYEIIQRGKTV